MPGIEVQAPVNRERTGSERDVIDIRGGDDGQLGVVETALDTLPEAHEIREVEVDRRVERIVSTGFGECLVVERLRLAWFSLDGGELDEDRGSLDARCRLGARSLEQGDRTAVVAGGVVPVGGEE